ncbi:hypothetical protein OROGR_011359 [Orobanche gracilis]
MLVKEEAKALKCIPGKEKKRKRSRSEASSLRKKQPRRAQTLSRCARCSALAARPPTSNRKPIVLIRISGKKRMDYEARQLLFECFRLTSKFTAVFLEPNDATPSILRRVQPYVTYGN